MSDVHQILIILRALSQVAQFESQKAHRSKPLVENNDLEDLYTVVA